MANPKNNKRKGHDYEMKAINELKGEGYDTIHAGASLGPYDIWATNDKHFRKIQVKSVVKPRNWQGLIEMLSQTKEPPNTIRELWVWLRFKGWTKIVCNNAMTKKADKPIRPKKTRQNLDVYFSAPKEQTLDHSKYLEPSRHKEGYYLGKG